MKRKSKMMTILLCVAMIAMFIPGTVLAADPPVLQSAYVAGNPSQCYQVELTYDKAINGTTLTKAPFSVTNGGNPIALNAVTLKYNYPNVIVITTMLNISTGIIKASYNPGGGMTAVLAADGATLNPFTDLTVPMAATPQLLSMAVTTSTSVELTFDKEINPYTLPHVIQTGQDFTLGEDGGAVGGTIKLKDGNPFVIELDANVPLHGGAYIYVAYNANVGNVASIEGAQLSSFSGSAENTLPRPNLPDISLPAGIINVPYNCNLLKVGTTGDHTDSFQNYATSSYDLPPGLSISADGIISGTPTTVGNYTAYIRVYDAANNRDQKPYAITIKPAPTPPAPVSFQLAVNYTAGGQPYAITAGDINNDGYTDLAVTNGNTHNFTVLLGSSSGIFTGTNYGYIYAPIWITAGQFNSDSNLDLAITANSGLSVYAGDGSGAFSDSGRSSYGTNTGANTVETADFNGDGLADLAVTNDLSDNISVFLQTAGGTLGAKTDFGVGDNPCRLAASDFNGDGNTDLAVVNYAAETVTILIGDGSGSFTKMPEDYAAGIDPIGIAAADFNGDGFIDLAITNFDNSFDFVGNVTVLRGNGDGSFSKLSDLEVSDGPVGIVSADFNGDGYADLAVTNRYRSNVSILCGDGSGGFAAKQNFSVGPDPMILTAGDFNGDGKTDLAVVNYGNSTVSILFNGMEGGGDTAAPTWSDGSTLTVSNKLQTSLSLTWSGAADDTEVTGYKIFKDGDLYQTVGNVLTLDLTELTAGTQYTFKVEARDAAGNWSSTGPSVTVTTDAAEPDDILEPTWSEGSTLTAFNTGKTSLTLTWAGATDITGVTGYRIYRGEVLYKTVGNVLTTDITGLTAGTQYTFKVEARDAAGNWSSTGPSVTVTTAAATHSGGGSSITVSEDSEVFLPATGLQRFSGLSRIDTALEIAKAEYPGKVANVIVATADNYPDALAGSVLAYKLKAPILLVGKIETEQEKVLSYLKSNLDAAGTVYILGGTGAVDKGVEGKISAAGFNNIVRIGGIDRYETAAKIADTLALPTGTPVVLVNGENYPDALSISSMAAVRQNPILLVQKDGMSAAVSSKITQIKPAKIYIIGLEGVVSTAVGKQAAGIAALNEVNLIRIGGADRYETSLKIAQYFNSAGATICVATGNDFPDALAGSVYAANSNAPILLVDVSLSANVVNELKTRKITGAVIFGGEGAVSKSIEQALSLLIVK